MPTQRFLNLSDRKKQLILKAALEEFSTETFDKASINKIIQRAGISRGSFYTYFTDKEELLRYAMEEIRNQVLTLWIQLIDQSGGDLFAGCNSLILRIREACRDGQMQNLHRNFFAAGSLMDVMGPPDETEMLGNAERVLGHLDRKRYRIGSGQDFQRLINLIGGSIGSCILRSMVQPGREEEILADFRAELEILKYGVCIQTEPENQGARDREEE